MKPGIQEVVVGRILTKFDELPNKYKPTVDRDGLHNWVTLSGIALVDDEGHVEVVAISTGMKCLPRSAIASLRGIALHDSHAEVIAIRLLNHFLLTECHKVTSASTSSTPYNSPYLVRPTSGHCPSQNVCSQPFAVKPRWRICMYCSEAPCGDASMELIMARQEDATPWAVPKFQPQPQFPTEPTGLADTACSKSASQPADTSLMGRGYFSELGAVRRKPARGDSPPTLSKSCTDKIALKQCNSLLSSLTSLLIEPSTAYLHTLILPASQYVPEACERAFGLTGRMATVAGASWEGGYTYRPFEVSTTNQEFRFSRRAGADMKPRAGALSKPSNLAMASNPHSLEVIIGGILQGRKKGDFRGASAVSRQRTWELFRQTKVEALKDGMQEAVTDQGGLGTYCELKASEALKHRRLVKEDAIARALRGWVPNEVDNFGLD